MNGQDRSQSALGPYRVLDLTDEKGVLCTKTLADLGADVIKVEPPGGDPMRRIGPFYHDEEDPEKSLFWFTFNTSKRSITLDITKPEGRGILKMLAKSADFLVECFPPGYLDGLGLGYATLSTLNPRLVVTSITNFGQTGPYSDYRTSDIIGVAMGGFMNICGDPDRPPVRVRASQAYHQAGSQAAVASLIAHHHRQNTGEGQHVDVSMQEAVSITIDTGHQFWDLNQIVAQRRGSFRGIGRPPVRMVYPCKDGFVAATAFMVGKGIKAIVEWMDSEGMAEDLNDPVWFEKQPPLSPTEVEHITGVVGRFFLTKGRQDLFETAQRRRVMVCPVNTAQDIFESPQLESRQFFVGIEHPELGETLTYAGAPFKMTESPWRIWRRPPLIGEHNAEIYCEEMGYAREELKEMSQKGII